MDSQFYEYAKSVHDKKKAMQTIQQFAKEVTGKGKTQEAVSMSGSKPTQYRPPKPKYAHPTSFSGLPPLGAGPRGKTIKAHGQPPKAKKNDGVGIVKKVFTTALEKPPDGRFNTKSVQSLQPWKVDGRIPMLMTKPPIRLKGQKLFPLTKAETEVEWKKLMAGKGAKTKNVTANSVPIEALATSSASPPVPKSTLIKVAPTHAGPAPVTPAVPSTSGAVTTDSTPVTPDAPSKSKKAEGKMKVRKRTKVETPSASPSTKSPGGGGDSPVGPAGTSSPKVGDIIEVESKIPGGSPTKKRVKGFYVNSKENRNKGRVGEPIYVPVSE